MKKEKHIVLAGAHQPSLDIERPRHEFHPQGFTLEEFCKHTSKYANIAARYVKLDGVLLAKTSFWTQEKESMRQADLNGKVLTAEELSVYAQERLFDSMEFHISYDALYAYPYEDTFGNPIINAKKKLIDFPSEMTFYSLDQVCSFGLMNMGYSGNYLVTLSTFDCNNPITNYDGVLDLIAGDIENAFALEYLGTNYKERDNDE